MPRPPYPKVHRFRERIELVAAALQPNPELVDGFADLDSLFSGLQRAASEKSPWFPVGHVSDVRTRKTWLNALEGDNPPRIFIDWLCAVFPELDRAQFVSAPFEELERKLAEKRLARARWTAAVKHYASHRQDIARLADAFYGRAFRDCPEIPLLTRPGWIRKVPLRLVEGIEDGLIHNPAPGFRRPVSRLPGLSVGYVEFKDWMGMLSRRKVRREPHHNGEIFCVDEVLLDSQEFVGFRYRLGHYFDYVNSCEALGAELADWALNNSDLPSSLPLRGNSHDAFDFTRRAAYPGVNCLTLFLNYSDPGRVRRSDYFLLHKRDETQLQAQNTVHVLPAGGHQPFCKGAAPEDTAIWRTIVREFCEELFDKERLNSQPESWEDFLCYPEVADLVSISFRDEPIAAVPYLLGFGLDPVTLKPEVLVAIVLDWDLLLERRRGIRLKYNWEVQIGDSNQVRATMVPLSKAGLLRQAQGGVQSLNGVHLSALPAGEACMRITAMHLDRLLADFAATR